MAQIKKKHTAGAARNFITRTQAIRKLQVSLADFRRLCIFKGIYPREPRSKKKANKGSTAPVTFYYAKDIQYLLHEPVLDKFREHKTFAKKLTRALGRGDLHDAKRIDANRPRYHLDHIIKERYPTFMDALRDIDDALSMLFLFAALPASDDVSARLVAEAEAICTQWMAFVARERLVRKVFVSIKGVYYSANIRGVEVMWLVPFRFPQNIPADIDFRVMLTFLEFYTTLLHFVLYKLYNENGLVFPPIINSAKLSGVGGINAYVLESRQNAGVVPQIEGNSEAEVENVSAAVLSKAAKADAGDEEVEEEEEIEDEGLDSFSAEKGDALAQPTFNSTSGQLFSNFTIFIGREVPLDIIEFLIIAFGGKVISESAMDELIDNEDESKGNVIDEKTLKQKFNLASVTHQISDRPTLREKVPGRTYVQPQWVFDSINEGKLLPVSDYAPGETLPAHLSPWGDAGTYDPTADLSDDEDEEDDEEDIEVAPEDYDKDDEEEEAEAEAKQHQRELEAEAKGTKAETSEAPKKTKRKADKMTKAEKQEEEDKKLRMIMMSNKQKKLYKKMQYSNDKKSDREAELKKRRKLNEKKEKR